MDPEDLPRRFPSTANAFTFRQPVSATAAAAPTPAAKPRHRPRLDIQSRQIHRNRISYSCHACRRRKVKCDRLQPICSNCTKTAETACVYDEHVTRANGDVGQRAGDAGRAGADGADGVGGSKRRRTSDCALQDCLEDLPSRGGARPNGSLPNPPQKAQDAGKQAELETRMNRLAEIVNRWYKDASAHGARGVGGVPPASDEHGFAQSQHYLDLLQQSTGPFRNTHSSSSPSPQQTSPRNSTTPGSSIGGGGGGGHDGEISIEQLTALSRNGQLTVGMLNAGIEAARQSGRDDEVGDLGLGHLSIQGGGRSRYVGTSFWGLLSSEVRARTISLSHALRTHGDSTDY